MKIIISVGFIALLTYLIEGFLPWYSISFAPFVFGLFYLKHAGRSFLAGFLGISLLWLIHSFLIQAVNNDILTQKIAEMFSLPGSGALIIVTAIIGGLVGGFSGLTGAFFSKILFPEKTRN